MNCNECMHYKMCRCNEIVKPEGCAWFERREDFVKLPCRIGDPYYSVFEDMPGEGFEIFEDVRGICALVWDGNRWGMLADGDVIPLGTPYACIDRRTAEEYRDMLNQKGKENASNG